MIAGDPPPPRPETVFFPSTRSAPVPTTSLAGGQSLQRVLACITTKRPVKSCPAMLLPSAAASAFR